MPDMPTSSRAGQTEPAPGRSRAVAEQELAVLHEDAGADWSWDDERGAPAVQEAGHLPAARPGAEGSGAERSAADRPSAARTTTVRPSTTGSIGLLLAGRYRLDERRGRDNDSSAWDGHDTQLERRVLIRVVSGRAVPSALEGARVAAAHHAPGLTRILDTGSARATDGTVLGWVVEERPPGDRLDDLVRDVPLDAARSRAVVGQAARALAEAARAGCHHRALTPASLYVSGGSGVVSGLVVAAAAAGLEPTSEEDAVAEDGRGLASLLYAALTGLWPHDSAGPAGAQPRADAAALPLHVLLPDVPSDLDALVTAALSGSVADGPTPQTLADRLLGESGPRDRAATADASAREPTAETTDDVREISVPETEQLRAGRRHPPAPASRGPVLADSADPTVAGSADLTHAGSPRPGVAEPATSVTASDGGQPRRGSRRAAREARTATEHHERRPAVTPAPGASATRSETSAAGTRAPGARLREGVGSLGVAAGAAAGTALIRSRRAVRTALASSPPSGTSSGAPAGSASSRTDDAGARGGETGAPSRAQPEQPGAEETSGVPLIEEIATKEVRRGPSHLRGTTAAVALAVVAVLLVVVGIVALRQVPTLQSLSDAVLGRNQTTTAPAPATPGGDAAQDDAPPAPPPADAAQAPVITGVRALDPQGDGSENDGRAGDVVDGDPSTSWKTENYANAELGGLKDGVGVVLDLETEAAVSEVDLTVAGSGGEVEVRTSPSGSFEGSSVIARGVAGGATTLEVDPPVRTSHVIIWFTELPSAADSFTADLSQVDVR